MRVVLGALKTSLTVLFSFLLKLQSWKPTSLVLFSRSRASFRVVLGGVGETRLSATFLLLVWCACDWCTVLNCVSQ